MFDPTIPILDTDNLDREVLQTGLDDLKKQYSHYDEAYVANACFRERREVLDDAYKTCEPYLDSGFKSEISKPGKFMDRLWELALCSVLLHKGYTLEKWTNTTKARPDFCVLIGGKKVWIEAVCPDRGDVDPVEAPPVLVPGEIFSRVGDIAETIRPRALRVSSVLGRKFSKREKYIKGGHMSETDPYLIAINTHRINHFSASEMIEELVLCGMGLHQMTREGEWSRQYIPHIMKMTPRGEVPVPMAYFLREEYKPISGAIFFRTWFDFNPEWRDVLADSAMTYFNDGTPNPIQRADISFGNRKYIELAPTEATLREVEA